MRIMFVIPRMNNGGAERVVANLANKLCFSHSVKVVVWVGQESFYSLNNEVDFTSAGLNLNRRNPVTRNTSMLLHVVKAFRYLKKEYVTFNPDVIISFLVEADILVYLLHRIYDFFWVSSERNDPTRVSKIKQIFMGIMYKDVNMFVCQSTYVKDYYKTIAEKKKVVIPNPLDNSRLYELVKEAEILKIIAVGRLTEQKNFELLVRAYARARKQITKNTTLTIYGEGSLRTGLERVIRELNMTNYVNIPGSIQNVFTEMKDASLFIMSSDYEGFPNALLEACAMGIPVIATDIKTGTVREIVSEKIGVTVSVGNERELSEAITKMIEDDEYRKSIRGMYGQEIQEKYSIDVIGKRWHEEIVKHIKL